MPAINKEQINHLSALYQAVAAAAHESAVACRDYSFSPYDMDASDVKVNEATHKLATAAESVDAYLISLADLGDDIRYSTLQQDDSPTPA
jgi:hypothetical protein